MKIFPNVFRINSITKIALSVLLIIPFYQLHSMGAKSPFGKILPLPNPNKIDIDDVFKREPDGVIRRKLEETRRKLEQEQARREQEQARIEQARIEQARIEQARIEQARIEQARIEQARIEQGRIEQARIKQEQARIKQEQELEQARIEQARIEQAKIEQAKQEQAKQEQAKQEQAKQEQAKIEQARRQTLSQEFSKKQDDTKNDQAVIWFREMIHQTSQNDESIKKKTIIGSQEQQQFFPQSEQNSERSECGLRITSPTSSVAKFEDYIPMIGILIVAGLSIMLYRIFLIDQLDRNIFEAIDLQDIKLCKELLQKGTDPDSKNGYGRTALDVACKKGLIDICELLVQKGATVKQSHLIEATIQKNIALFKLLREKLVGKPFNEIRGVLLEFAIGNNDLEGLLSQYQPLPLSGSSTNRYDSPPPLMPYVPIASGREDDDLDDLPTNDVLSNDDQVSISS